MYHTHLDLWKDHLCTGLKEDGWPWDWTSIGITTSKGRAKKARAKVIAKSEGIWAAQDLVRALTEIGKRIQVDSKRVDGDHFQEGDLLVRISGDASEVLALERPFLNLAAYICGIATTTSRLVEKVKKLCPAHPPRITLTRKTLPGYRDIAIHGVRIGGGSPHRVTLSGGVLIKENHIAVAGGIQSAILGARKMAPHGLKIEIEVRSLQELKEALKNRAEGVLLDNFSPEQVRAAIKFIHSQTFRPFVEVSGGITESTIADYAVEGVDVISIGSLTHSVKSADLSLLIEP